MSEQARTDETAPTPEDQPAPTASDVALARMSRRAERARGANGRFIRVPQRTEPTESPSDVFLPEDRFLDREVSWLQFNERVLELATDPEVPLLERARYLAIFSGNLDEFFMVRVAGLKRRIAAGIAVRSASGLEPREVLDEISRAAHKLMDQHAAVFQDVLRGELEDEGIRLLRMDQLTAAERAHVDDFFLTRIYPVLTPLAVDPAHPFPYISGLSLNLAVMLINPKTEREHFARVKVPPLLPRLIELPRESDEDEDALYDDRFVAIEDVIAENLSVLFPGMEVREHYTFRVTRNEDLEVEEDDAENLLTALERELTRRRFGPPVRLEVADDMDDHALDLLVRELGVHNAEVYRLPEPLDLRALNLVADLDRTEVRWPPFVAKTHPALAPVERSQPADILAEMRGHDVLLHHPYDSFSTSVQAFIEQAAADPQVLAIKQTLYRTSGDSPIIDALIEAADAGKQVLAVVEIKARFDEENNITWARKLERSGVHVVYGLVGLKTHAKLCLVVRQEGDTIRRYCHVGTGNYNPKTARLYEDLGLLTTDPVVGEDLTRLFNQLSGMAPRARFKRLLVAPRSVRTGLINHIQQCITAAGEGKQAVVQIKVNSLVDEQIIDACYAASQAGVQVDIWVRGICALRPGVEGLSDNIRVRSILGRFLEHSRIFRFAIEGQPDVVYIGSADMMHRNLDRRVEALVQVVDPHHVKALADLIGAAMSAEVASWHLRGDGHWQRTHRGPDGQPLHDLQADLIEAYAQRRRKARRR
ncbi:RNA degradosome polyphosphate kinase [Calidifontibacter sp. DB0510]|uniref:Polyphosphate kinase n=1 Tax=Metallococcus carri TaxID=1656884 RepID=A0A967EEA9_9MICO|nr:RNA degradosome polyphosphate kinase [Metallococcus carri]NHN55501.1 RNA degradosome polyphosphate kinase [Metallococcus carri]NOP38315.1 RNA degradosome polyphosphate kinase [Calidifontibacter sp. DB2511S]